MRRRRILRHRIFRRCEYSWRIQILRLRVERLRFQRTPRHRVFQERAQHVGAVMQVVQRFKKRHDRQRTRQSARRLQRKSGFARQQINHQQIRQTARHADDQRADAAKTELASMLCEYSQRSDDGARFVAERFVVVQSRRMQKRPRRAQFVVEKSQPRFFVPRGKRVAVQSGGDHQLRQRFVVASRVLPHVQTRQMKAENLNRAHQRHDFAVPPDRSAPTSSRLPRSVCKSARTSREKR